MRDVKKYLDELNSRGYTIIRSKRNNHHKVYKGRRMIASCSSTTGDRRSLMNLQSDIRKFEKEMENA